MTGHGVGTALLQLAVFSAMSEGASHLIVKTERTNNRAIDFYRSARAIGDKSVELVKLALNLG
jgi:ribosomal protein S18 acetylase RimI-like enzyme